MVGYSLEKSINKIPTTNGDGVSELGTLAQTTLIKVKDITVKANYYLS